MVWPGKLLPMEPISSLVSHDKVVQVLDDFGEGEEWPTDDFWSAARNHYRLILSRTFVDGVQGLSWVNI